MAPKVASFGATRTSHRATRWLDAGKIDYALGGTMPVFCLGSDPRQYGVIAPLADAVGKDVLIVAPARSLAEIEARFGKLFAAIEPLASAILWHAGRPALSLPLYLGHRLKPRAPAPPANGGIAGSP